MADATEQIQRTDIRNRTHAPLPPYHIVNYHRSDLITFLLPLSAVLVIKHVGLILNTRQMIKDLA
jgi:hypothetical protein